MNKYLTLIYLLILMVMHSNANAGHILGGDISWRAAGDSLFINLTLYKDCNDTHAFAEGLEIHPCIVKSRKIPMGKPVIMDITPVCPGNCTKCSNSACSFQYGIQQYTYHAKLKLQPGSELSCCELGITYKDCCRSSGLSAPESDFYLDCKLNHCSANYDASPHFIAAPLYILPVNQCITYNIGAVDTVKDTDGVIDSLRYSFVPPLDTSGKIVGFFYPYSWDKPFDFEGFPNKDSVGGCAGLHINPRTGDISCRATKPSQTVIKVRVDHYSHDKYGFTYPKGYIIREIGLVFSDFKNNVPSLSGINGGSDFDTSICAGSQTCFTVNTYDPDNLDSVLVDLISKFPGATIVNEKYKKHPKATICWTPDLKDARTLPYQIVLDAHDNSCPAKMETHTNRTYNIHVRPGAEVQAKISADPCGKVLLSAINIPGKKVDNYKWTGDDGIYSLDSDFTHTYNKTGQYKWKLETANSTGCFFKDTGTIILNSLATPPSPVISGPTEACLFTKESYSTPLHKGNTYNWDVKGGTIQSWPGNDSIEVYWDKSGPGILNVSESNGCIGVFNLNVNINPDPAPTIDGDTFVCTSNVTSYFTPNQLGAINTWKVNGGTIISGQGTNIISVTWTKPGNQKVILTQSRGTCKVIIEKKIGVSYLKYPIIDVQQYNSSFYRFETIIPYFSPPTWSFSDGSPDQSGNSISHTFVPETSCLVTLSFFQSSGGKKGCKVTDDTLIILNNGIQYISPVLTFLKISPNPFHDQTNITYSLSKAANVRISLADIQGKEIQTIANQNQSPGEYTQVLDAQKSGIAPGVYLLKVFVDGGLTTKEIIRLR